MVLNLLPAFFLLGWDFLVRMFYKLMLCTSCTCSGQNGTTGGGGGGGLVSNGHTISSLIARPCLTLSTRLKQQKRTAFKDNNNYFFTIRKFALYVSYAQINQPLAVDKTRNMEHSGTTRNTKKKINKNKGKMKKKVCLFI